jgi:TolB-like protein
MSIAKAESLSKQGPTAEEILEQMERVLSSDEFHAPERGRKFFRFVVMETLDGRSQFLKAFTIANEIFGRETSFDAQNDPVVRIEAGRIRRSLERYYLVVGQTDAIVITIPKGGYVPHFAYTQPPQAICPLASTTALTDSSPSIDRRFRRSAIMATLTVGTVILVAAASVYFSPEMSETTVPDPVIVIDLFQSDGPKGGAWDIAQGLRDEVIGQLATFDDIVVVADPSKAEHRSSMDYTLQGNVLRDGDRLRSITRLVRRSDATVIWANDYDADLRVKSILQIQADIGQEIATAVAQPYGAIFMTDTDKIARPSLNGDGGTYACTLAYYSYRKSMDAKSHIAARDCLQRATERFPTSATSWALLSLIYLDEMRFRYKLGVSPPADAAALAAHAAERAVSIAPNNSRALQAVMLVNFFNNDIDEALKAGAAAYAKNANDTEVAGEYGLRLAMSGKWQSGCELISTAINKNAGPKGYYEVGMALCALMRGDLQAAELWSRMCDLEYNPMHRLTLLSILGSEGKTAEALQERDWLNANAPELMKNIRREVSLRLQRKGDQERFLSGLRSVGVDTETENPEKEKS